MSRLGPWQPATTEDRLDRLESLAEIQQLAQRYAVAVDSRNLEDLVGLFTADVRVGPDESGRPALHRWFGEILRGFRVSIHLVSNHVIDFADADHARGIVYCRDQLERPATGRWDVGELQYWDRYVRVDGEWYFQRRKFHRWYLADALERPAHGAGVNDGSDPLPAGQLPDAFESWSRFWADAS